MMTSNRDWLEFYSSTLIISIFLKRVKIKINEMLIYKILPRFWNIYKKGFWLFVRIYEELCGCAVHPVVLALREADSTL